MRKIDAILLLAGVYFSVVAPAFGHIDPFNASIIVQAIIGVVAVWLFFGRSWLERLKADAPDREPVGQADRDIEQPE